MAKKKGKKSAAAAQKTKSVAGAKRGGSRKSRSKVKGPTIGK